MVKFNQGSNLVISCKLTVARDQKQQNISTCFISKEFIETNETFNDHSKAKRRPQMRAQSRKTNGIKLS